LGIQGGRSREPEIVLDGGLNLGDSVLAGKLWLLRPKPIDLHNILLLIFCYQSALFAYDCFPLQITACFPWDTEPLHLV
jgi:hypothetical protein